jgi:DNA-binding transcriptional MerR regulator
VSQELIRIGALSRLTNVPVATLRFYEKEGLLQCVRTRTKYRVFCKDQVNRVRQIVHLKSLKIPLTEIRRILSGAQPPPAATREYYLHLKQRLRHIQDQKKVWDEQEQRILLLLESLPPGFERTSGDEQRENFEVIHGLQS